MYLETIKDNDSFYINKPLLENISIEIEKLLYDVLLIMPNRNDINIRLTHRLKKVNSIKQKLSKKSISKEQSILEGIKNVDDIFGYRIVTDFLDDCYKISNFFQQQQIISFWDVKGCTDYIKYPKDSGYRSIHLILDIPLRKISLSNISALEERLLRILFPEDTIRIELQIRTLNMDLWATLEHAAKYKPQNNLTDAQYLKLEKKFKKIAEDISHLDTSILELKEDVKTPECFLD